MPPIANCLIKLKGGKRRVENSAMSHIAFSRRRTDQAVNGFRRNWSIAWLGAVLAMSMLVLIGGWALGDETTIRISAGLAAMVPSTAFLFAVCSIVLIGFIWAEGRMPAFALKLTGMLVGAVAFANGAISVLTGHSGIDQAVWSDNPIFAEEYMSLATSICFGIVAVCMLLLQNKAARDPVFVISATIGLLVSLLAIIASVFNAQSLYEITLFAQMALHSAACFAVIFASLLLARPDRGWVAILSSRGVGAASARRSLPIVILLPLVLCLGLEAALRADIFQHEFGLSLLAMCMMVVLAATVLADSASTNRMEASHEVAIRKLAHKQAMQAAEERGQDNFRELAKATPVAIYQVDSKGRFCFANNALEQLTGRTEEELLGIEAEHIFRPDPANPDPHSADIEVLDMLNPDRSTKRGIGAAVKIKLGGRTIWARNVTKQFRRLDERDRGAVGALVDLTDYHNAIEDLRSARDQAKSAVRAKSSFLANMSHEIRTPMNGVLGFAKLLMDSEDIGDTHRTYAGLIHESGESLVTILNDILDLSKIEAGKLHVRREDFELRSAIEETVRLMRGAAMQKSISLEAHFARGLPQTICSDKLRMGQVLGNLLGNAIKFTEAGEVRVEVQLAAREKAQFVQIAIYDTGIGIPANRIDHIFDEFVQSDTSTARNFGGTGLGLPISRQLAQLMGGTLSLTSRPGEGTCAMLELPLMASASQAQETQLEALAADA